MPSSANLLVHPLFADVLSGEFRVPADTETPLTLARIAVDCFKNGMRRPVDKPTFSHAPEWDTTDTSVTVVTKDLPGGYFRLDGLAFDQGHKDDDLSRKLGVAFSEEEIEFGGLGERDFFLNLYAPSKTSFDFANSANVSMARESLTQNAEQFFDAKSFYPRSHRLPGMRYLLEHA